MKKRIAILGSTGSIGTQTLEVIKLHNDKFKAEVLAAGKNTGLLIKQAIEFKPAIVIIADDSKYNQLKEALEPHQIAVHAGKNAFNEVVKDNRIDDVVIATVGFAGLIPTINAIKANKTIALANKETLVVAGKLIVDLLKKHNANIYPVDSEHSAIFQCLIGEKDHTLEKIYLTASGGPFRGKSLDFLKSVTKEEALQHPNWNMGNKVTIDSASLMNKGLEVIEAKWLFGLENDQIDVLIHPQSIIHSIVQFKDGSMKAQMGLPDMKLPIQYALTYPGRLKTQYTRLNFNDYPSLTFEKPDTNKFKNLALAFDSMRKGGNMPCILNAANEIAVDAFLKNKIGFLKMTDVIEKTINKVDFVINPDYDCYLKTDKEAREIALQFI